jgi:hypothetical protein
MKRGAPGAGVDVYLDVFDDSCGVPGALRLSGLQKSPRAARQAQR